MENQMNSDIIKSKIIESEMNQLIEITGNYKKLIGFLDDYQKAYNSRNHKECKKVIEQIKIKYEFILNAFEKISLDQKIVTKSFVDIKKFIDDELNTLPELKEKFCENCATNMDREFNEYQLKITKGNIREGIHIKNFYLEFNIDDPVIIIHYLDKVEKFQKIEGLNIKEVGRSIQDFYQMDEFTMTSLEKKMEKLHEICSTYRNKENQNIKLIPLLRKYLNISENDKVPLFEKIKFSFAIYRIKDLNLKTNDGRSLEKIYSTGEWINKKDIKLNIPNSDTTDSDNCMEIEFRK